MHPKPTSMTPAKNLINIRKSSDHPSRSTTEDGTKCGSSPTNSLICISIPSPLPSHQRGSSANEATYCWSPQQYSQAQQKCQQIRVHLPQNFNSPLPPGIYSSGQSLTTPRCSLDAGHWRAHFPAGPVRLTSGFYGISHDNGPNRVFGRSLVGAFANFVPLAGGGALGTVEARSPPRKMAAADPGGGVWLREEAVRAI